MKTFKTFLKEYLTDKQRDRYRDVHMSDKARADTDHFFGVGNDVIHSPLEKYEHDKSEIHKKIESHLGKELSTDEYRSGTTKDKYGRDSKIGRLIKDSNLRNQFASDTSREGSRKGTTFTTSTHRGIEVAGQTNSTPNEQHPKGHSWGEISCKNVDTGDYKHYLKNEIKHGTVVHFVHDQNGQEIYRATLQPHYQRGNEGVVYSVNSEYGIQHPDFTKSAQDVANKLSTGSLNTKLWKIKSSVSNDDEQGETNIFHPNITSEHISKALDGKDPDVRKIAIRHPRATPEHISKALDDESWTVRRAAIEHPNATSEHISKALNDESWTVRRAAIQHPKATPGHISKALKDEHWTIRQAAIQHPKATPGHISKALKDEHWSVRVTAIEHPNATPEHISKALKDDDIDVRRAAQQRMRDSK